MLGSKWGRVCMIAWVKTAAVNHKIIRQTTHRGTRITIAFCFHNSYAANLTHLRFWCDTKVVCISPRCELYGLITRRMSSAVHMFIHGCFCTSITSYLDSWNWGSEDSLKNKHSEGGREWWNEWWGFNQNLFMLTHHGNSSPHQPSVPPTPTPWTMGNLPACLAAWPFQ